RVRGPPSLEDLRRACRRDAARAHVVLERDRDARQRPRIIAAPDGRVDGVGGGARFVREYVVERVDLGLARLDGPKMLLDHITRRTLAGAYRRRDLDRRRHGASPRMRGTRN